MQDCPDKNDCMKKMPLYPDMPMSCTIDIFEDGKWQPCCTVTVSEPDTGKTGRAVLSFCMGISHEGRYAPSLRYFPQPGTQELPQWPSFLLDLIPQGEGRQYLHEVLSLSGGPESDWPMLLTGAINPVGKIRVREALAAYQERIRQLDVKWSQRGFTTEEVLSRSDDFVAYFDAHGVFTSGATSVQGKTPKLLLTQGKDGLWYADATLPDERAARHYIVKMPRAGSRMDKNILRHEALYMRLAQDMGLFVAELPQWREDVLFVPRFDRSVAGNQVMRHAQESLVSLAGLIDPEETTHNLVLETLRQFVASPCQATLEYIRRDVMNLAMGNMDSDPYNTAVQTIHNEVRLSPLYDFSPTYLDGDGASCSLKWVNDDGNEVKNWADILEALPFPQEEKSALRRELRAFGKRMENLEKLIEQYGISDDIAMDRYYGVRNQCWQLGEL